LDRITIERIKSRGYKIRETRNAPQTDLVSKWTFSEEFGWEVLSLAYFRRLWIKRTSTEMEFTKSCETDSRETLNLQMKLSHSGSGISISLFCSCKILSRHENAGG